MGFLLTIVHIWTIVVHDVGGRCRLGGLFLVLSIITPKFDGARRFYRWHSRMIIFLLLCVIVIIWKIYVLVVYVPNSLLVVH
jgi:hypothetical protein